MLPDYFMEFPKSSLPGGAVLKDKTLELDVITVCSFVGADFGRKHIPILYGTDDVRIPCSVLEGIDFFFGQRVNIAHWDSGSIGDQGNARAYRSVFGNPIPKFTRHFFRRTDFVFGLSDPDINGWGFTNILGIDSGGENSTLSIVCNYDSLSVWQRGPAVWVRDDIRALINSEIFRCFIEGFSRKFSLPPGKISSIDLLQPISVRDDGISDDCNSDDDFKNAFCKSPYSFLYGALGVGLYAYEYISAKVGYGNWLSLIAFFIGLPMSVYGIFKIIETTGELRPAVS